MITQCPIRPGKSYTYKFNIIGQEGTLWWHAHVSILRATVYGALIILPREGPKAYPFRQPYKEVPILLGEWWNANVVEVENEGLATGLQPNKSDAYTINGRLGDLYRCSDKHTYKLDVEYGKTYLLRIINAAVNNQLFFKMAGHSFTVVAMDAGYTVPYRTDVLVLAPGQTIDALMVARAPPSRYYMAARAYISSPPPLQPFDDTTTTGIVRYKSAMPSSARPAMPLMPDYTDTPTAHRFYTSLTGLLRPGWPTVPLHVDEHMFVTFGLGVVPCRLDQPRCTQGALAASMNNVSFEFPTETSLLEAHFKGVKGIYTRDFPDMPPLVFDFANENLSRNPALMFTSKGTKLKKVKYNATVEMVLQNTAIIGIENHPIHLHGFNFFVLAQGFGNFDWETAVKSYNLVHPQVMNTIAVPTGGWAVIRFVANNPGEWWNANVVEVENEGLATGLQPNKSDAYTINGRLGDLYRCSDKHTYKLDVEYGKTYLLRIINAAVNNQLFFKMAGHSFTVVAMDAGYTVPYRTDVLVLAPGQTIDALMVARAPPSRYYMAARAYISSPPPLQPFDDTTTTGIVRYKSAMPSSARPAMPLMPDYTDTPTAHRFYTSLTGLLRPGWPTVPLHVDEHMFVTFGLGVVPCRLDQPRCTQGALAASMNNVSFEFPTETSLLEAHFKGVKGIYTRDFPDMPPLVFDFANENLSRNPALMFTSKGTKLKKVKYNATVEMVLQNTAIIGIENHPIHLHGFNFFVLAQGFGNFDWETAVKSYNLVHPQVMNTIAVPTGGWAVIRFVANNPAFKAIYNGRKYYSSLAGGRLIS
ncbi:Laccase [Cocos nucifera]|uniref:laccase n=1 Tax=Cocos nucifera TaxID=13894 RepID=A0A8K0IS92_COCNU|nr:Laccase [Cocos nucifera]